jgi:hypothetical protein
MPTTTDLLGLAIDKSPVDFADQFNQIMMAKAADAVEAKRIELAQGLYGDEVEDEDFDEADMADDMDDDIDDDIDLEDLDIDLDDLDLEGIINDQDA